MSHRKKQWRGRALDASAEAVFENALLGKEESSRKTFDPNQDRKTKQLCQQVRRALALALAGECGDDALRDLYVDSVEPIGGPGQLMVRLAAPASGELPVWEILRRLDDRSARLRTIIAQSICRKRAPNLSFIVIPHPTAPSEGGGR